MRDGDIPLPLLSETLDALGRLPAGAIGWADGRIARLAMLHHETETGSPVAARLLLRETRLAKLYLFHRDGRIRQAALDRMVEPPETPFFLAALAWRLNDWAEPVRLAARRRAELLFPLVSADTAVAASPFLLTRWRSWQRWNEQDEALVEALFARADVTARLSARFAADQTGSLGRELRHALRVCRLDVDLPALARVAAQPAVRGVALKALLDGYATWPVGYRREWIDKRFGIGRNVMQFGRRPLDVEASADALIGQGLRDPSPLVRRIAADALIERRATFPGLDEAIAALASDRSPRLRERAAFLDRKRREDHVEPSPGQT